MCAVSAISDYGRQIPFERWTPNGWQQYVELIEQAEKFDEANGEPECEDPSKAQWMKEVEARLQQLEAKAFRQQS